MSVSLLLDFASTASTYIFGLCNGLKMVRVYTTRIAAQVIQDQSFFNRAYERLIYNAVRCSDRLSVSAKSTITEGTLCG